MKHFKNIVASACVAASLIACTKQTEIVREVPVEKIVVRVAPNDSMDADSLASAGEQLINPYTWMLADKVFAQALIKDPNNFKAQLYRELLKPFMVYRGILVRSRPYTQKYGTIETLNKTIREFPESPLKDFLLDGKEDIKTVTDIHDLFVQQRDAFDSLRIFLKTNQDKEVTLNLNPYVWEQEILKETKNSCVVTSKPGEPMQFECNYKNIATKRLNSADLVALSQMFSGYVLYYSLLTSYSLEGGNELAKELDKIANTANDTPENRVKLTSKYEGIGHLRKDHSLTKILGLGADLISAARWAVKFQDRLCPKGQYSENQRPGQLFSHGICVNGSEATLAQLDLMQSWINGPVVTELSNADGEMTRTTVDLKAFLTRPPQNLRTIVPATFDKCGKPASMLDKTLGGFFVNGDADRFYVSQKQDCQ